MKGRERKIMFEKKIRVSEKVRGKKIEEKEKESVEIKLK